MINSNKFDKIKGLIYTEKSNLQQTSLKKYFLSVVTDSSKKEIASIIKESFNVDVIKVNIINSKEKKKKFKGIQGIRSSSKRAIVTLKEGQSISLDS
jgi:large subunit ribosomal protein L23